MKNIKGKVNLIMLQLENDCYSRGPRHTATAELVIVEILRLPLAILGFLLCLRHNSDVAARRVPLRSSHFPDPSLI